MSSPPVPVGRIERALVLHKRGLKNREIAAKMGVAPSTVHSYLYAAGVRVKRTDGWEYEAPSVQRARIERELDEGKRCHCWLLLPCADHQP